MADLGDIADFKNGKALPKEHYLASGQWPVYGSNGEIARTDYILNPEKVISIGRVGAYCGAVYAIRTKSWVTDNAIIAEPKEGTDFDFLFYLLSSLQLNRTAIGSAQPLLTQGGLKVISLPEIPSYEQQKIIGKSLKALDDKIALNKQINETLESMAKAIFKEWFIDFGPVKAKADGKKPFGMDDETAALFPDSFEDSDFGLIPKDWKYVTCKDFGNIVTGTTPPSKNPEFMGNIVPFVTPSDYSSDVFITNTSRNLSEVGYHSFQNRIVKANSVMVTSIGSDLGKVALSACEVLTNQQINSITVKELFHCCFLYLHFATQQQFLKSIAGGSATPIINKSQFEDLIILSPKDEIVIEFDKVIKPIFELILFNQYETTTLNKTRDILLPKLISGGVSFEGAVHE